MTLNPEVLWAQRRDVLYITISIPDIQTNEKNLDNQKFTLKATDKEGKEYAVDLEFYDEVEPEKSKVSLSARNLFMVIYKKGGESAGYWPRLLKQTGRVNFLKTDFSKWVDEDEEDEEEANPADQFGGMDFSSLMANAGAGGMAGMPGMPGMGGFEGGDSDDEIEEQEEADFVCIRMKVPGTHTPKRNGQVDEERYRQKYKDIKKRIHDIEEDNDILNVRLHKARKNIGRLRLERSFLLERIEKSRDHLDGDSEESDGISDILSHNEFDLHHSHSAHRKPAMRMFDKPQRRKKDPNAPKGPGNVFFLYCRLERDKIKDQYPNENLGDVTKLLGQKWKSLTKDEKQKYYDMYKKEQEEYEAAMKSYNKENPNSSYTREPSPPVSHTSPLPADDFNTTSSLHAISSRDHGVEMTLNSSQQGSSLLDEDEDLMEAEPLPTQYQASNHELDAASDELAEDEDSADYQAYHSHFSPKHSNALPEDFQDQSKFAPVEDSALASSTK